MLGEESRKMTLEEVDAAIKEASDQITKIVSDLATKTGMEIHVVVSTDYRTAEGVIDYDTWISAELHSGEWRE